MPSPVTTIGVALAVPEPWGNQLQDYRRSLGDVTAPGIPTHITLLPPFEMDAELMPEVEDHLQAAAQTHRPFDVHLRGTGTFRPVSPVVFVSVVQGISGCEQLAKSVRKGPLATRLQFPFHPHVTIAHDLDETALGRAFADLGSFEATFEADRFWLYRHDPEAGWVPTRDFPLRG